MVVPSGDLCSAHCLTPTLRGGRGLFWCTCVAYACVQIVRSRIGLQHWKKRAIHACGGIWNSDYGLVGKRPRMNAHHMLVPHGIRIRYASMYLSL